MHDKIDPADYARLMNAAKRRSQELRREAGREGWLQVGSAAREVLQTIRRVMQAGAGSARQLHQKGPDMPTLTLKISPPQTAERCEQLAISLTALTAQTLGKRADVTVVVIDELPVARWFVAGSSAKRPTALLEISITQGTNSAEEKARFIAAAYDELQRQLGGRASLEPATYVSVRELAATDWGFGGLTQAARKLSTAI